MAALMHEAEKIKRVALDLVVDVKGKRSCAPTRETMRPDMVAALPSDHLTSLIGNPLAEGTGQPLGNLAIFCLFVEQVNSELPAENNFHGWLPKTSSNFSPGSLPEIKSFKRRARSALISSSVRGSSSRLRISSFASSARSAGNSESASSATARFVSA